MACNYSSLILYVNGQILLNTIGNFTPDYISGICVAGFMLLKNYNFNVVANNITVSQLEDIDKLSNSGRYISEKNRTTREALKCSTGDDDDLNCPTASDDKVICDFRVLKPDDGTIAIWTFDHNEGDSTRWNLIMTDNIKQFMVGLNFICELLSVNVWDYILGPPIESEGGVSDWKILT